MSEIKVNKLSPRSGTDITLGNSGTDFIVPSGATITVNSGGQIVNNGTATGFFEGIAWQAVTTAATLTAIAGKGYPINTTSNACTVTLPSSASVGDQVQIVDYAGTFATNNITLTSSLNIEGGALDKLLTTNREGVTITYVDATQGWVATSGVNEGTQALDPKPFTIDFLVVAGGGPGGGATASSTNFGAGGGAGGYRTSSESVITGAGTITITVGAGGIGALQVGTNGGDSIITGGGITSLTSTGGGSGAPDGLDANDGGSGGGAGQSYTAGISSPVTSPVQGHAGGLGTSSANYGMGGGGGAGAVGGAGSTTVGGAGGVGVSNSITGSSIYYAGGGGGSIYSSGTVGPGGLGGGGDGSTGAGSAGTDGLGGGGGGSERSGGANNGGDGGDGVVILSMPDASYSGTTTGSPTVATGVSGNTVLTFTGSGSYTI
jgi:hypothetical protein